MADDQGIGLKKICFDDLAAVQRLELAIAKNRRDTKYQNMIKTKEESELSTDNPLSVSFYDSAWIPMLNPTNILEYFSRSTFYDRTCNNEHIKMQRLNPEHLNNMTGLEYILLHVQDPILYVVRKQHRHSPQQVTPLADYYIIAGGVYQSPDLCSVLNARVLNTVHSLQSAFEEAQSFSRYHPSKGYTWEFSANEQDVSEKAKPKEKKKREEPSSMFQRQRVDLLLGELAKKFPPKFIAPSQPEVKEEPKVEVKVEVKTEKVEEKLSPSLKPLEKKIKQMR